MLSFKEQLLKDLDDVFYNTEEFAELKNIYVESGWHEVRAIINDQIMSDRKRPSKDHAEGLILFDLKLSFPEIDLGFVPKQGRQLEMDDEIFDIVSSSSEAGEVVLELSRLDE